MRSMAISGMAVFLMSTILIESGLAQAVSGIPSGKVKPTCPGATWEMKTPEDVGLSRERLDALQDLVGGSGCVVRYGYMAYTWGDASKSEDIASAVKPVISTLLFFAVQERKLKSVDGKVADFEPGLKTLNDGKDAGITWRHLASQTSGYGLTEPPGKAYAYNDFALALYYDMLTQKVFQDDGTQILKTRLGDILQFQDPYTFERGRPGRLGISVRDFSRFGLLYLRGGKWKNKQLMRPSLLKLAISSSIPDDIPRSEGTDAPMLPGQRTLGGGKNQTSLGPGHYSFNWWINKNRAGKLLFEDAPPDTYMANGHWNRRMLWIIPSLNLIVCWNDSESMEGNDERCNQAARLIRVAAMEEENKGMRSKSVFPGDDWIEASPESQGVSSVKLKAAMDYLSDSLKDYGGIETMAIVRNGYLIRKGREIDREFCIYSATKSFTSTVLGLLIADSKVTLNTFAKKYVPYLAEHYPRVTIRHFATMTSGYDAATIGYEIDDQGRGDSWDPEPPAPPLFPPGTKFRYWDDAMMQFGNVLTKAAGEPLDEIFKRRVADPIGMKHWRWDHVDLPHGRMLGWTGSIYTTSRDLVRFGHLFLNRGNWNGKQLISASWVDQATSVQVPASIPNDNLPRSRGSGAYGYNWWVNGIKPDGKRMWPGAPPKTCLANGLHSNVCFVVPEWRMVIARTNGYREDGSVGSPANIDEIWSQFFSKLADAVSD